MKQYLFAGLSFFAITACAQKTSPQKTTPKQVAPVLKNKADSMSYAVGLSVINFYKDQGIDLNPDMVSKAITDIKSNKKPLLTQEQSDLLFMCHSNPQLCEYVKQGEAFLADNWKKENIKVTPSGLQYEVITMGTGPKPLATDTVIAHYSGKLFTGQEFDNSYNRGTPLTIPASRVIKGWTEGLQLMPVGSKFKFYIPYQLGYGLNDQGAAIPGGSVLVFELELLGIKGK
jgi:FKBP-type peptidyl-prolyl cis-trans isomerase FklB